MHTPFFSNLRKRKLNNFSKIGFLIESIRVLLGIRIIQKLVGPYRLVKGCSVAIMGVDGSGKSSLQDKINERINKTFLSKKLYLGNKFMVFGWAKNVRSSVLGGLLLSVDKRFRLFQILFWRSVGAIVILDRYVFDDLICRSIRRRPKGVLSRIYRLVTDKNASNPDLLVFLDVSRDVAFSRKQDYSLAQLSENIRLYREWFNNYQGPKVLINADDGETMYWPQR